MTRLNPWEVVSKRIKYADKDELAVMDVDSILAKFDLDWSVELYNVAAVNSANESYLIDDRYATMKVKEDSVAPLAVVGGYYKPTQNIDFANLLHQVRREGFAEFVSLGQIKNGRTIYAIMELNDGVDIPGDPHAGYLIARTSHDGSSSLNVSPLLMRISCTNAINGSLMRAKNMGNFYNARHTLNTNLNYDSLIAQLHLTKRSIMEWSALANKLLNISVTDSDYEQLKNKCFAYPSSLMGIRRDLWTRSQIMLVNKMSSYREAADKAWYGMDTQAGLKNTKYGILQALIEAVDHRKDMTEAQAKSIILDKESELKQKALELVTVGS